MRDELLLALIVRNVCCLKGSTEEAGGRGRGDAWERGGWDSLIGLLLRTLLGAANKHWAALGAEQSRAGGEERKGCALLAAGSLADTGVRLPQEKVEVNTAISDRVRISGHRVPDPPQDRMTVSGFAPRETKRTRSAAPAPPVF